MNTNYKNGSALILVLIGILILSLLGVSALTHTSSDLTTARNFVKDKTTFFFADSGINEGIARIKITPDPTLLYFDNSDGDLYYKTGKIEDSTPQPVGAFSSELGGFDPPPPKGFSIEEGAKINVFSTAYLLTISARKGSKRPTRKEIDVLIYRLSTGY